MILPFVLCLTLTARATRTNNQVAQSSSSFPVLPGRLVFHSYINYGESSSNLYLLDFLAKVLARLNTAAWNLLDPMNAHISRDGKKLVFMARQASNWHVFIWTVGAENPPLNLTAALGGRNEYPKFSSDGKRIVFKHEGDIQFATLCFVGNEVIGVATWHAVTSNGWMIEESMLFISPSGK